jgi:hypothetical protein
MKQSSAAYCSTTAISRPRASGLEGNYITKSTQRHRCPISPLVLADWYLALALEAGRVTRCSCGRVPPALSPKAPGPLWCLFFVCALFRASCSCPRSSGHSRFCVCMCLCVLCDCKFCVDSPRRKAVSNRAVGLVSGVYE